MIKTQRLNYQYFHKEGKFYFRINYVNTCIGLDLLKIKRPLKMFGNRQSYANPMLFGQHSSNQIQNKTQEIKPTPVIIMNENVIQKQTKPNNLFAQQRSSIQFNPPVNTTTNLFSAEPTNKELNQKIISLEGKNRNLQQMYKKLKHQFDTYKASSLNKNDFLSLLKEIDQLKQKVNSMKKQEQIHQKDKLLFHELKQSVQTLNKINDKKENQLTRAILLIEKQSQIIQNQTLKIDHLSEQIQKGLSQKNNDNQYVPNKTHQFFSQGNFCFGNQKNKAKAEQGEKYSNKSFISGVMLEKKQSHPLSQSAVFKYPTNQQNSLTKIEYTEGNYLIQFIRDDKGQINQLKISNLNGRIQVLQRVKESDFKSRPIQKLVRIQQNSCQIIDPIFENRKVRLTTFNFMNCKLMSLSQKLNLRQQVQQQVKKCGLYLEDLDLLNGNLYLLTKK